jgi:hypothetical protein
VFCARPRGQVIAAFSDQFEREVRAEAIDLGEVLTKQREERRADIEGQAVSLSGPVPTWRRQWI